MALGNSQKSVPFSHSFLTAIILHRDLYGSVMWRYKKPNKIFNMKMKIYKPLQSYPTLTY